MKDAKYKPGKENRTISKELKKKISRIEATTQRLLTNVLNVALRLC